MKIDAFRIIRFDSLKISTSMKVLYSVFILMFLLSSCSQGDNTASSLTDKIKSDLSTETTVKANPSPQSYDRAMKVVDVMPYFGGCENMDCSNQRLIKYIQDNLKYPKEAKDANVEGKVFIQFIVETDGTVSSTFIKKDVGAGLGEAAVALVNKMNEEEMKWTPGIHKGKEVAVQMLLPVSYKLE